VSTVIVLAMHGSPPKDVPRMQVVLDVGLHMAMEHGPNWLRRGLDGYFNRLDTRIRTWPRTAENDPFYAASQELAVALREETGCEVLVGFNEFCAPTLDEALDQAVAQGAERVVVVTPMMTRGGEHAEADIPAAIDAARARHPGVEFVYAWPFDTGDVARFLAQQLRLST
jgi:sirohydrochlorin cobaltochelatase